jgi:hypothetical protein
VLIGLLAMLLAGGDAATSLHQRDPFARAGEVFRFSFEKDEDRDFNYQPDDWSRRKGPKFPTYVRSEIDRAVSQHGDWSLRLDVNGGRAVFYSPSRRVDSLHAYVFDGWVRTQGLTNDAAMISLSFLNHKRQRVQRVLSRPVTGTHKDWAHVRIGPIFPKNDVWFVVVGCHVVPGKGPRDLTGQVWFDNLWLGRLPQLTLVDDFDSHFKQPGTNIRISANVGGLDRGPKYNLQLKLFDRNGKTIRESTRELLPPLPSSDISTGNRTRKPLNEVWSLPPQPRGFYRVQAALKRNGEVIIERHTTFIVMDPIESRREGEFGWSVDWGAGSMPLKDLARVASQSGIHWLKFPMWQTVSSQGPNRPTEVIEMGDVLAHRRISLVGVLRVPPAEVREKFAAEWTGVSEIFTLPPKFWWPAVEPVIARYSSVVRHWQVGGDHDASFVGLSSLPATVVTLKREFDRIGRDTRLIIPWNWKTLPAVREQLPHTSLSIAGPLPADVKDLEAGLQAARTRTPRWVVVRPRSGANVTAGLKAGNMVKQLVAAKAGRADAIFADGIFDRDHGLLTASGAPTPLFLPWRTTALALQNAEYAGSLSLSNGSRNYVFTRDGEGIVVLWRDEPGTEEIYLGPEGKVIATDIWGRQTPVPMNTSRDRQVISVGPEPVILRGCTEGILRLRLSLRFQVQQFQSRHGGQSQAVLGKNMFGQGVSGRVKLNLPRGWSITPGEWQLRAGVGEDFQLPATITVPSNASLGDVPVSIDFQITADQPYSFRIHRSFRIGMGDVAMQVFDRKRKDGRLEIRQIITNNTTPPEILSFRTSLFVPGYRRQRRDVVKLGNGKDKKFYFLPDAEALRGKTLWIRAEQIDGNRVLNFRWKALENETPETEPKDAKTK